MWGSDELLALLWHLKIPNKALVSCTSALALAKGWLSMYLIIYGAPVTVILWYQCWSKYKNLVPWRPFYCWCKVQLIVLGEIFSPSALASPLILVISPTTELYHAELLRGHSDGGRWMTSPRSDTWRELIEGGKGFNHRLCGKSYWRLFSCLALYGAIYTFYLLFLTF